MATARGSVSTSRRSVHGPPPVSAPPVAILSRMHYRVELAGHKQPKGIRFLAFDDFPRSASGKVRRHELESRLAKEET